MSRKTSQSTGFGIRQLGAAICLLSYLWLGTPLAAIATAVVASLDEEHRVELVADQSGMKVLLHHDSRGLTAHVHCLVSTALVLMADDANAANSDHVLSFQKGGMASLRDSIAAVSPRILSPASVCLDLGRSFAATSARQLQASVLSLPPPNLAVSVVRSTVFLI